MSDAIHTSDRTPPKTAEAKDGLYSIAFPEKVVRSPKNAVLALRKFTSIPFIDFDDVPVGINESRTLKIVNEGKIDTRVTFLKQRTCPFKPDKEEVEIPAGEERSVIISWTPDRVGDVGGCVTVLWDKKRLQVKTIGRGTVSPLSRKLLREQAVFHKAQTAMEEEMERLKCVINKTEYVERRERLGTLQPDAEVLPPASPNAGHKHSPMVCNRVKCARCIGVRGSLSPTKGAVLTERNEEVDTLECPVAHAVTPKTASPALKPGSVSGRSRPSVAPKGDRGTSPATAGSPRVRPSPGSPLKMLAKRPSTAPTRENADARRRSASGKPEVVDTPVEC